jgi:hypothetical protein
MPLPNTYLNFQIQSTLNKCVVNYFAIHI